MKTNYWPTRNRIINLIVLLLACFALSQSTQAAPPGGTQNVNVVNTTASPALVRDVDKNANQPFFRSHSFFFSSEEANDADNAYVVPAGKRLVIEYVSAGGRAGNGEVFKWWRIVLEPGNHLLTPIFAGSGNDGFDYFSASAPVRLYGDAGSRLFFDVGRCQGCTNPAAWVSYSVSGYLVDVP